MDEQRIREIVREELPRDEKVSSSNISDFTRCLLGLNEGVILQLAPGTTFLEG